MPPFQFSEYDNAFRRPSNSKRSSVDPVAGAPSTKTSAAAEASKRAHLNRRSQWNGVWPAPTSGPATRSTTPPRTRARTPPRASWSGTGSTPRGPASGAEPARGGGDLLNDTLPRSATPPRPVRDASRRSSEPSKASLSRADAGKDVSPRGVRDASPRGVRDASPRSVRDTSPRGARAFAAAAGSARSSEEATSSPSKARLAAAEKKAEILLRASGVEQPDPPFGEDSAGLGTPRRATGGGSSSSTARVGSGKYVDDDPAEDLCCRWEAWAQSISHAADEGATLPPPPVPQPNAPGVTAHLLRVMEASAFAAAALARGSMDAKGLRTLADSLESDLTRSRAEAKRLQADVDALERRASEKQADSNRSLRRQVEDLEAASAEGEAEVQRLRERSEELASMLAAESAERKQAEQKLRAERNTPCSNCEDAQLRLSDVADEVESLRAALKDAEARRRKEVEDALWIADNAEAKHEQILSVLRQVLSTGGSVDGMRAAAAALPGASLPRDMQSAENESRLKASSNSRAARPAPEGTPEESALFERIDFDKNGTITRQEFRRAWRNGVVDIEVPVELPRDSPKGAAASQPSSQRAISPRNRGTSPRPSPSNSRGGAAASPRGGRASPRPGRVSPRSGSARAGAGSNTALGSARSSGGFSGSRTDEHDAEQDGAASRLEREVVELCRTLGGDDRTQISGGGDSTPSTPRGGLRSGGTLGASTPRSSGRGRGGGALGPGTRR